MLLPLRSLTAHPLRSALTALAIALGVAMMLAASVIGQAASQSAERLSAANPNDAVIQSGPAFNTLIFQALLALVGVIVLFTAGFVIANAFGMAVTARLKELGALRTLGMTRRQVLNLVLIEAGLLGLAGSVGGVLLGIGLAGMALRLAGMGGNLSVPVWALIASPLIGFTITVGAALLPALQASRISPLEALRPASRFTPHASRSFILPSTFILLLLVGLGLYAFIGKPDVFTAVGVLLPAMVVLLALVAMLMPALVGPVANLARPWLIRWVGHTAGRLATDNLQRHPTRAALTAGAMTAGLTMMIAISGLMTVFLKGGLLTFATIAREDRAVLFNLTDPATFRAENSLQMFIEAPPLPPELLARLQTLANAGQVELDRLDMVTIPAELSPTPSSPGVFMDPEVFVPRSFAFSEGNVEDALRYFAHGPAVLLLPITAQRLNLQVGDTVSVQTLTGPVEFTVAGIGADVWVMTAFSFTDGQKYFGVTEPTFMGISVREGQNQEVVLKKVDALVAEYGLVAFDMKTLLREFFRIGDQIIGLMNALLLLTVLVAALGVVNTMVINVTERQREIGMLRAIGATQRQVRQMVVAEGATLGLFAVAAAVLVSFIIVLAYFLLVSPNGLQSLGFRLNWEIVRTGFLPALPVMAQATLIALIFAPLIAGLAAYYPARQAAAMDVMEATRSEELSLQPSSTQRAEGVDPDRALPTSFTLFFLARVIQEQRTRFILSVLAVSIGVAVTIAADYLGGSVLNLIMANEDARTLGGGLFSQFDSILKFVGVSVSLAVGFLIFNAFAMSFTQRRQQLGTLRTLGTSRWQVIRLALAEAALIGGVGTLLGLVVGQLLGRGFIALLRAINTTFNAFVERGTSLETYLFTAALGLGVPLIAMLIPALNASRLSPLVALKAPESAPTSTFHVSRFTLFLLFTPLLLLLRPPELDPPFDLYGVLSLAAVWVIFIALALPSALESFSALARILLARLGATGLLMADNLRRARTRTTITAVTLTVGVTLIIAVTGGIIFWTKEILTPQFEAMRAQRLLTFSMLDMNAGLAMYSTDRSLRMSPELIDALKREFGARAYLMPTGYTVVPELSGLGDSYFSFILDPIALRDHYQQSFFTFIEGDWEHAMPLLEQGCGVLVTPAVAKRNNAALYDTIVVSSPLGKKVSCTIAGIGEVFVNASLIGDAVSADFDIGTPMAYGLIARSPADRAALLADLNTFGEPYGAHTIDYDEYAILLYRVLDLLPQFLNGILLFAILAAALGVVNTTLISLHERRRELGQLRAVGMTRRQALGVVVGEAALIGLFGTLIGIIAGAGFILILALTMGGKGAGMTDFPIYGATFRTLGAGMVNGIAALLIAPVLCALAAYFPARSMLRGAAIETLQPEQTQPITRERVVGVFNRGSIQARFVIGTAVLLLTVLFALIQVVTAHARNFLVNQSRDSVSAIAGWNATMIELALPADAQTIALDELTQVQGQNFDADSLLRFRSLLDDMSAGGLEAFLITNQANEVVVSFDQRDIGDTLEPLADKQRTVVREDTTEDEADPRLIATAPIHNQEGSVIGSLRMTMRFAGLKDFLDRVRNTLWVLGAGIVALGLLVSYLLSRPFTLAARALAQHANRVRAGDYSPLTFHSSRFTPSVRTRLTLLMTTFVIGLVGLMGLVVIPIEREQLNRTAQEGGVAMLQWMGDLISESIPTDLNSAQEVDLAQLLTQAQNLDLARLQALMEETRNQGIVYLTLTDLEGTIVFSDKLALQGEPGVTASRAQVTEGEWRDEKIFIGSTPLRHGRDGEQIGTLGVAFSQTPIETFLAEAQNLFWLAGLSAVLAGLLLAQALGGAVAAPMEILTTGARRVAQGDLKVRFTTGSRDELAQLGVAFNAMVTGLREREKLRDLFGRYVGPEVREAVLSGKVTLTGERKTITCLYVDMRGSTAFAEKHAPEDVMAALNQYFEVIILATEAHGGIVNRFVGDEAVCLFGAPTEYKDHADRALQAALAMREGLAYLNQKRATLNLPTLKFGMGLNTGEVVAGATGSEERQEYTVIGDAMNTGARIQGLTKDFPAYDILLSEFTRAALGDKVAAYALADLGPTEIRGKALSVRIFGLIGKPIIVEGGL